MLTRREGLLIMVLLLMVIGLNGYMTYSLISVQQTMTDLFIKVYQHDVFFEILKNNPIKATISSVRG